MSKLTEYLKLLPKGFKNLDKVIEGLSNQIRMEIGTIPKEDEEIIIGRRLICSQCPFNSVNAVKLGTYATKRTDPHCILCGCNINAKTASLESDCGANDHNKKFPNKAPIPLRWFKTK